MGEGDGWTRRTTPTLKTQWAQTYAEDAEDADPADRIGDRPRTRAWKDERARIRAGLPDLKLLSAPVHASTSLALPGCRSPRPSRWGVH
jgi:hypothetical protein